MDIVDNTWFLTLYKNYPFISKCDEIYTMVSGVCIEIVYSCKIYCLNICESLLQGVETDNLWCKIFLASRS
jgi:hypothetical protein